MTSVARGDPAKAVLVLFRHDLRLSDNRALHAAHASGKPVVTAYVLDDGKGGPRPRGAARRWWLHHSLAELAKALADAGTPLVLRRGPMAETALALAREAGADLVVWNRRYDPPGRNADRIMAEALARAGIGTHDFDGALLHEPSQLKTTSGGPYRVYTPFWRALARDLHPRDPAPRPRKLDAGPRLKGDDLAEWKLLPTAPDWSGGLAEAWTPGESGAGAALRAFVGDGLTGYAEGRDFPARPATSRLSPHLAHGEITPYQIWHALAGSARAPGRDIEKFRMELGWREFSHHLLHHDPNLATANFNRDFDAMAWRTDRRGLLAWQKGQTGYPVVDAGMRELWRTGWMHNRVRLVTASFLVKHLLIDWRKGEEWFWDTLVDADPADNAANWQWVAGSGADAAPYYRVFNPVLQGEKFDPDGRYVRRYVPEVAGLPDRVLHHPWDASAEERAKMKLGADYPVPVVEHRMGRERALAAYQAMRGKA